MSYYPNNPQQGSYYPNSQQVQNYPQQQYPQSAPPPPFPQQQNSTSYPQNPAYPQPQPGYPPQQPGYPTQQSGYGQPAYPPQPQPGYAPPQPAYPQTAYPPAQPTQPMYPGYGVPVSPYPVTTSWNPQPVVGVAASYTPYPVATPVYPTTYAPSVMATGPARPPVAGLNYSLQFKGNRLDRKDVFSKSDPFLILLASKHPGGYLSRQQIKQARKETKKSKKFGEHSNNWVVIHRTETIHNCQNPVWQPFVVNLFTLCAGNLDTPFKVEVWDYDSSSAHDFIGSCVTTIRDLQVMREMRLINKRRIGIFNSSGQLEVLKCAPA